jgi:hypothetical protein
MPTKWFAAYVDPRVAFCSRRNRLRTAARDGVGAQHPKEVARMININRTMTAQHPSFGASAYGQTSLEATAISAFAGVQVSTCVRVRHIGDMGLATAKDDFPGTTAWRPPTC